MTLNEIIMQLVLLEEHPAMPKGFQPTFQKVIEAISEMPEIIRCKDCKNYYFADNRVPSEQSWVCDAWGIDQTAHMGYCFKAERKEE